MLAPPRPPSPPDDLELLIREARARQRRRQLLAAAGVALVAAAGLSVWAAIPGRGGAERGGSGGGAAAAGRGLDRTGRVQISQVGTSGGVTWVLNGNGMWLTTNGGRTWRASAPRQLRSLGDLTERVAQVGFVDRRLGWLFAVDVPGGLGSAPHFELYGTNDGGRTWHSTIPGGHFSFVSRRVGFVSRDKGLYETRNGGVTWNLVEGPNYGGNPTFVDAQRGVMLLDGGLLRTADSGRHWKDVLLSGLPPAAGNKVVVSTPVAITRRRLVLAAERDFAKGMYPDYWRVVPYVSDDGGASWSARPLPRWWVPEIGSNDGNRFSVAGADVWFAAARRELAMTTDAGRTWRLVRPVGVPARWSLGAIDFTSARVGWAILAGPRQSVLMRTTDGGVHWKPAAPRRHRPS